MLEVGKGGLPPLLRLGPESAGVSHLTDLQHAERLLASVINPRPGESLFLLTLFTLDFLLEVLSFGPI